MLVLVLLRNLGFQNRLPCKTMVWQKLIPSFKKLNHDLQN